MTPPVDETHDQGSRRYLNPAEEAVWLSDRPGDPRVVGLIARFGHSLDLQQLQTDLSDLFDAFPVLRSWPETASTLSRRHFWAVPAAVGERTAPVEEPLVVVPGDDRAVQALAERLRLSLADLQRSLAVGVVHQACGDVLILLVHHAIMDGLGALELLRVLLQHQPEPDLGSCDVRSAAADPLSRRGNASQDLGPAARVQMASATRRRSRPSVFSSRPVSDGANTSTGFGYYQLSLTTAPVSTRATVNDMLIAATAQAIRRWNSERGRSTGRVTVRMPIDTAEGRRHGEAANVTGQAVICLDPAQASGGQLLTAVTEQTREAKDRRTDVPGAAERVVARCFWLPAVVRRPTLRLVARCAARVLMPSVTVTNLGRADATLTSSGPGRVTPRALYLLTTAGMPQGITVTALGLNSQLHLMACYAHQRFTEPGAREFLQLVVDALAELAPAQLSIAETH